ncbi:MAG: phenylalanine--tRNA ligase subunit alpha, partial [Anaerolineales bacterium]|nr:phenylalanine--tRNA ligase subunit alpha [Anaerolineales bacterium]
MLELLHKTKRQALSELQRAADSTALKEWRSRHLGKESALMQALGSLGSLPAAKRPAIGRHANEIHRSLDAACQQRTDELRRAELDAAPAAVLDVTLPGRPLQRGRLHIATQTLRRIYAIWADMGFQVYRSPDVETDEYNFELLNIPAHHPARDMWDTFHADTPGV